MSADPPNDGLQQGRRRWLLGSLGSVATGSVVGGLLSGCGSAGGDSSGIGSGGSGGTADKVADGSGSGSGSGGSQSTASVTVGSIAGYGSVIVNGVAWDETKAAITYDDGTPATVPELTLGRVLELRGAIDSVTGRGQASTIVVQRALIGPVDSISIGTASFVVLGRQVVVDSATAFDDGLTGLSSMVVGQRVAVFGAADADGAPVHATRVELAGTGTVVQGRVAAVNPSLRRITVGTLAVSYAGAQLNDNGSGLAVGQTVRAFASSDPASGVLTANRIDVLLPPSVQAGAKVSVEGSVTRFDSTASFVVQGYTFDARSASVDNGTLGMLAVGSRVEVTGQVGAGGVVVAGKLTFDDSRSTAGREFEAEGSITSWTSIASFVVRGVRVDATGAKISGGSAAALRVGTKVHVHGWLLDAKVTVTELEISDSGD